MKDRHMRVLPFPPTSNFTPEIVRLIKAIPEEALEYTEEEIAWMERAVKEMDKHLEEMIRHAKLAGKGEEVVTVRKAQYEKAIEIYRGRKRESC